MRTHQANTQKCHEKNHSHILLQKPLQGEQNMDEKIDFKEVNKLWDSVKNTVDNFKKAEESFSKMTACEDYNNPFHNYDLEKIVQNTRIRLVQQVVKILNKKLCPNVMINPEDVQKEMDKELKEDGFCAEWLQNHIKTKYAANQGEIAFEQILANASKIVPYVRKADGDWGKADKPEYILKGRKLCLKASMYDDRYGKHLEAYRYIEAFSALEKLVLITLKDESPAKVQSPHLRAILQEGNSLRGETVDTFFKTHQIDDTIKSIRFFKNGNVQVEFGKEEEALKIAEELTKTSQE